jgi:FeS assembly SUF system protein
MIDQPIPKMKTSDEVNEELAQAMIPPMTEVSNDPRSEEIIENLRHVYDPEIPVNIYELGLIYEITHEGEGKFYIKMTLTAPNCPVAGEMPIWVEEAARKVEGITDVTVDLTFDPPWNPTFMAETAKLMMNMF